ncbi:MAG: cyclic pyranopterin monophosphate synthase MoaC [Rhodothalassiaceae bacterium]
MSESPRLSHLDDSGAARMVDVGAKPVTTREAVARAIIVMSPATRALILDGKLAKGDALACARIAGIMAAKRTSDLIPLCHPLPLDAAEIDFSDCPEGLEITALARTSARTGVEMEALSACAMAALTLYDMAKSVERGMRITDLRLVAKTGGRSGAWHEERS